MLDCFRQDKLDYALGWVGRMRPLEVREEVLVLGVPDRFYRDWVDDHYRPLLESTLARVTDGPVKIGYEVVAGLAPSPTLQAAPAARPDGPRPPRMNARFTFQSYVVADSNQLAAAAAAAVSDSPGRAYNPLYVYGGTGLGKTHLLHAIGNKIWERDPSQRVVYLSSEQFTNEFIESVREQRMPEFRRKFRDECDVLLIDDVQFLGRKEETQREFFHTFNTLHELGKAIILTSDMVPAEVPGLEDRLRSRFSMGLITDIQEPNFETRVAILQKKSALEGMDLPDDVAHFIARAIQKNVRELEGALVKVSAIHSLSRQPVTVDFAAHVLKDVLPSRQVVDVESIQKEVARYYKVPVEALKEDRRHKALAHARQVAMYLSRKLTKGSFPEIAARFGKDHSTVISAVRKVEKLRETDTGVKRELDELEAKLTGE
nr:chromosomal replication initiator protein DnaA [Archangium primigenium]